MNARASRKLTYLQFVCAIMIIGLHTVFARHFAEASATVLLVNNVFRAVFDCATSTFFFLSAYLLFRRSDARRYGELLLNKLRTLALPYVLWNALYLAHEALRYRLTNGCWKPTSVGEVLRALFWEGGNPALWFLQVLFAFALLYPVLLFAVRLRYPAVIAFLAPFVLRFIPGFPMPYASVLFWLPCYVAGAYLGVWYRERFEQTPVCRRPLYRWLALALFAALLALGFGNDERHYVYWQLSPVLVWVLADGLGSLREPPWWAGASFFLYGSHLLLEHYAVKLYTRVCGVGTASFLLANVLLPCLCAGMALLVAWPLRRFLPTVYGLLTGGRNARAPRASTLSS